MISLNITQCHPLDAFQKSKHFRETQALPAQKGDFLAKKLMIRFSAKLKKNSKLKEKPQGFCNIRTKKNRLSLRNKPELIMCHNQCFTCQANTCRNSELEEKFG